MNKIVAIVLQNCILKKKPTEGICTCMYQDIILNVLLVKGKYTAPWGSVLLQEMLFFFVFWFFNLGHLVASEALESL